MVHYLWSYSYDCFFTYFPSNNYNICKGFRETEIVSHDTFALRLQPVLDIQSNKTETIKSRYFPI